METLRRWVIRQGLYDQPCDEPRHPITRRAFISNSQDEAGLPQTHVQEHEYHENVTCTIEMRADSAQAETGFWGHINSHGGFQIMGNSFSTSGGPFRSSSFLLCTGSAANEMQTTGSLRVSVSCLTLSSPLISRAEAMSYSRSIARSVHPPTTFPPAA